MVAFQTEEGIRVYSPDNPRQSYLVTGTVENPQCTCPEFGQDADEPLCEHIRAVEAQLPHGPAPLDADEEAYAAAEREGLREENAPAVTVPAIMLIKRSVSPDGRIDSLSVEFSCPVDHASSSQIRDKAEKSLALQAAIISRFLELNGNGQPKGNGHDGGNGNGSDESIPAKLLGIAGMNTRYGWKLFINVEASGQVLKFFGNRKQLAEAIEAAGYPNLTRNIAGGISLNVPCRIITRESEDGRYTNVEKILAAKNGRPLGRSGH
jgi:hypothetical protein